MTSTLSVSEHKRGHRHHAKNHDGKPREGSRLRAQYDALRRGEIITRPSPNLSAFYGMDLELVLTDTGRIIGSRLVGEWDGPYYIPVERIVSSLMEPV